MSAYDHQAMVAFKTNAISYLSKPADKEELLAALSKAKKLNDAPLNKTYTCHNSTVSSIREPMTTARYRDY